MRLIKFLSCLCLLLYSCGKNNEPPIETESISNGALVLCEGLFQQNNAQLSFVSFNNNQIENNVFLNRNGRQLGDTGNDIKKYGNKIYIVVNVSSTIEVLDANTLRKIRAKVLKIDLSLWDTNYSPLKFNKMEHIYFYREQDKDSIVEYKKGFEVEIQDEQSFFFEKIYLIMDRVRQKS